MCHRAGGPSPSMLEVLTRSVDLLQGRLSPRAETADRRTDRAALRAARRVWACATSRGPPLHVKAGEAAVNAARPGLERMLPWLRASDQ